ncbi:uncharacterized protein LOC121752898 [Salvia splendens]|uniref:uncharacterized protein LOC121752898 n=1 Tax=Salvia splendens TaxID=180675 RepID=UPI001C26AE2B|nr:uncharacterized protein LOC121752898 [Salvia splendens]
MARPKFKIYSHPPTVSLSSLLFSSLLLSTIQFLPQINSKSLTSPSLSLLSLTLQAAAPAAPHGGALPPTVVSFSRGTASISTIPRFLAPLSSSRFREGNPSSRRTQRRLARRPPPSPPCCIVVGPAVVSEREGASPPLFSFRHLRISRNTAEYAGFFLPFSAVSAVVILTSGVRLPASWLLAAALGPPLHQELLRRPSRLYRLRFDLGSTPFLSFGSSRLVGEGWRRRCHFRRVLSSL